MGIPDKIQLLKRNEIDDSRWNNCIGNAHNGLLYAYTWYLDHFAENWFGLVFEEYHLVMAVPFKKKMGIPYIYHPPLVPQLGLMGDPITPELLAAFINTIPGEYKLVDYPMNNQAIVSNKGYRVITAVNYTLSLQESYEELKKRFNTNTTRNIAKNRDEGMMKPVETKEVIQLVKEQFTSFPKNVLAALDKYSVLNDQCPAINCCRNYGYMDKQGNLEAAASIMFSHNRIYYLLASNSPEAKKTGASHKIVDAIIRDHAGRDLILDFEGSDIPGIAQFYNGFGATAGHYQRLYINKINFLLRWLLPK